MTSLRRNVEYQNSEGNTMSMSTSSAAMRNTAPASPNTEAHADVKVHPYFQKIDWTRLTSRKIKAPWTPQLDNKLDLSNFDTYDEDDQVPEFTGDQSPFSSF